MDNNILKENDKEIPSVPTSYRILIKGTVSSNDSKQLKVNVDDKRHIWRQCSFKNPARSDGLVLKHWRHFEKGTEYLSVRRKQRKFLKNKITKNIDDDTTCTLPRIEEEDSVLDSYSFARVNPSVKIYRYSDDFYLFHLADLDPSWTKDETDLLFDLCEIFELRFIAVHDCFKWRKDIPLEKLKQRYYSVTKRIVEFLFEDKIKNEIMKHGNPNHPMVLSLKDESSRHPLIKFTYNSEHDRDRRQMLERSYRITPEQRELENKLLNDIKQAEIQLRSEEKKRNEMKKLKRKFNMNEADVIPVPKIEQMQSKPVWLASSCVSFYKSQLTQHHNDSVDEMLSELNITPPVVSSLASNELYCIVRGDAAIMINVVNKVESLRKELEHWQQVVGTQEPEGSVHVTQKVKEESHTETPEHGPIYPIQHTMIPKPFPKPKQPLTQIQGIGLQPSQLPPTSGVQLGPITQIHDETNQEVMLQAARQRMIMQQQQFQQVQGQQQQQQQIKQMYTMKTPNSGGASPQAFPQHMYPQFQQQMYHPQMNQRFIQQHMAQRMMQQQQFQQGHYQHMMPMNPEGHYSPSQRYSQQAHYQQVMMQQQQFQQVQGQQQQQQIKQIQNNNNQK